MKKTRNGIIMIAALTILMLAVPMSVIAMGNSEKVMESSIDEDFLDIAQRFEDGEITREEALEELHALQDEKSLGDSDRYREMERLMTAVCDDEMTAVQAREQLRIHQDSETPLTENKLEQKEQIQNNENVRTNKQNQVTAGKDDSGSNKTEQTSGGNSNSNSGGNSGDNSGSNSGGSGNGGGK